MTHIAAKAIEIATGDPKNHFQYLGRSDQGSKTILIETATSRITKNTKLGKKRVAKLSGQASAPIAKAMRILLSL